MTTLFSIAQIAVTIVLLGAVFYFVNKRVGNYFAKRPHMKFRYQLIQMSGGMVAVLFVILLLPFDTALRDQLLRLYGLIISATIALSSTTLVGNMLAGFMLRVIGNCRPGNFITVGDYFGRISEMDLLHTEIQTEERDLTTLPNLYLVTNPVRVMRTSGTLLSVEVSLGYDISRQIVEELLIQAAKDAGLEKPYVQIRSLGDFSATYQVSGLLKEVKNLLDTRRELRARTMDILHAEGIEIVSPTFMNTRAVEQGKTFISEVVERPAGKDNKPSPDSMAFDKAEKAESVEKLREALGETEARMQACKELLSDPPNAQAREAAEAEIEELQSRVERLSSLIARKEEKMSKD